MSLKNYIYYIPWAERTDKEWRGVWGPYIVGGWNCGINSRIRAIWLVIVYRLFFPIVLRRAPEYKNPFLMHVLSGGYF